jgi:DNA-damage-inducible protein J
MNTATKENMTAEVRTRITPDLKEQATEVLSDCGLNVSDAVRLFLTKVVTEGGIPFAIKTPNATTIAAMREGRKLAGKPGRSIQELFDDLGKTRKRKAR